MEPSKPFVISHFGLNCATTVKAPDKVFDQRQKKMNVAGFEYEFMLRTDAGIFLHQSESIKLELTALIPAMETWEVSKDGITIYCADLAAVEMAFTECNIMKSGGAWIFRGLPKSPRINLRAANKKEGLFPSRCHLGIHFESLELLKNVAANGDTLLSRLLWPKVQGLRTLSGCVEVEPSTHFGIEATFGRQGLNGHGAAVLATSDCLPLETGYWITS